MNSQTENNIECCPPFDPKQWEDKLFDWENKKFIRDKVFTLFFMPMNFTQVMKRLDRKVKKAEARVTDHLCLADHTSKWNMDVFLAIDKEVTEAENIAISGKFYSKVYEGPFKDTRKWCKDFESNAKAKGFEIKKWYMWYTTCPKCAKKYGKNHVVIISQV